MKQFVYWEPGSCLALALVSFKSSQNCAICLDYFLIEEGYACSKNHFLCWECFEGFTKSASEPDSVGKSINDKTGNLLCPDTDCTEEITLQNAAEKKIPKNLFDLLEKQKTAFETKKVVEKALQEQKDRMDNEHRRLMAIQDIEEREAEKIRLDLIENVLTLRCPRCKTAFLDYTGCAALTCSTCKAGFCAICLKDCGNDAHAHVVRCPENSEGGVFIPEVTFNEHHRNE